MQLLPQTGFDVRKLKAGLSDVWFTDEFSGYQTRFMRLFSVASDRVCQKLREELRGLSDIESPHSDIDALQLRPRTFLVVENRNTGVALPDLPDAVAFMRWVWLSTSLTTSAGCPPFQTSCTGGILTLMDLRP